MKLISAFLICSFLFSCSERKIKNDIDDCYLKGNVKLRRAYHYDIFFQSGKIEKGVLDKVNTDSFDKFGNIIESYSGFYKQRDHRKFSNKYDNKGLIISKACYTAGGKFLDSFVYKYNDKGYNTYKYNYNQDGSIFSKVVYQNDDRGNCLLLKTYKNDELTEMEVLKYDHLGNILENDGSEYLDSTSSKLIFKYDDHNFVIQEDRYDGSWNLISRHNYKILNYDKLGNPTIIHYFHNDTPSQIVENEILYY